MTTLRPVLQPVMRPVLRDTLGVNSIPPLLFDFEGGYLNGPPLTLTGTDTDRWYTNSAGVLTQTASATQLRDSQHIFNGSIFEPVGLLRENTALNKCTSFNANPTGNLNMNTFGDPAAILSVVDNTAELAAAGYSNICSLGNVYKFDNSAGVAAAQAATVGPMGNTNIHSLCVLGRVDVASGGDATMRLSLSGTSGSTPSTSTTFVRIKRENITPSADGEHQVSVNAGVICYFVLAQLEESSRTTSEIVTLGATATRLAETITFPNPFNGYVPSGTWRFNYRPTVNGNNEASAGHLLFGTAQVSGRWEIRIQNTAGGATYPLGQVSMVDTVDAIVTAGINHTVDVDNIMEFSYNADSAQLSLFAPVEAIGTPSATGYEQGAGFPEFTIGNNANLTIKSMAYTP